MRSRLITLVTFVTLILLISCSDKKKSADINIVFLHHSTGQVIWNGKPSHESPLSESNNIKNKAHLPGLFEKYNSEFTKSYAIEEMIFPKASPYGWNNYPFDYYNIWIKNAGDKAFMKEPTLEMLTQKYQVIIFKHCFPVSNILPDDGAADIGSDIKTLQNYKLQYVALKEKLNSFPDTKFILFTGAVQVKAAITEDEALRYRDFYYWVTQSWDQSDDNIYIWDLYALQTEGDLYFKDEYAVSHTDSHPNEQFAGKATDLLFNRIIDVVEHNGSNTELTGSQRQ